MRAIVSGCFERLGGASCFEYFAVFVRGCASWEYFERGKRLCVNIERVITIGCGVSDFSALVGSSGDFGGKRMSKRCVFGSLLNRKGGVSHRRYMKGVVIHTSESCRPELSLFQFCHIAGDIASESGSFCSWLDQHVV